MMVSLSFQSVNALAPHGQQVEIHHIPVYTGN